MKASNARHTPIIGISALAGPARDAALGVSTGLCPDVALASDAELLLDDDVEVTESELDGRTVSLAVVVPDVVDAEG